MRRFVASCSVVLLAIAFLGACGGSDEKEGVAAPGINNSDSNADGNNSSNDDYAKLIADAANARFKITYKTGSDGDEQTYAQDGKGNSVSVNGDTQFFTSADGSVSCSTDGTAVCTKVPGTSGEIPFLGFLQTGTAAIDALGGRFGDTSSKTIAGRDATCLSVSLGASASYCLDKDTGVLLEISTEISGKQEERFIVTKFEEPSDSDFTPPATPDTLPSISYPPGYTGPTIPGPG